MKKIKAWIITTVIMALWAVVLYLMWAYSWRGWNAMELGFFFYGFGRFGTDLGRWLLQDEKEAPRHRKAPERELAEEDAELDESLWDAFRRAAEE